MAEKQQKELEDLVKCSICFSTFTDPKRLECDHVFCKNCLLKLVEKDRQQDQVSLTCPICHQVTPVPANGVADLLSDFRTQLLLDIQNSLDTQASTSEDGAVDGGASVAAPPLSVVMKYCLEHRDEELKLYCEPCNRLVCYKCVIKHGKHYNHDYEVLEDAFEKYKSQLKSLLEPMKSQVPVVDKALAQLDALYRETEFQHGAIKEDVDSRIGKLRDILEERRTEFIRDLNKIADHKKEVLAVQRDQLKTTKVQLKKLMYSMKNSIVSDCQRGIMMLKCNTMRHITELVSIQPEDLCARTEADISFQAPLNVNPLCQDSGRIVTLTSPDPSRCCATLESAVVMVECQATISLYVLNYFGKHCDGSISCELESDITGVIDKGVVERKSVGQYAISYQPSFKGRHQLHISVTVHDQDQPINGSPFAVSVISSVDKLGSPIHTINDVHCPKGVAVCTNGEIIVAESDIHCISVFSSSGAKLKNFVLEGQLKSLQGIAVDGDGNILVIDNVDSHILKFAANGQFLCRVGCTTGESQESFCPCDIAYSPANRRLYVVDATNHVRILSPSLSFCGMFKAGRPRRGEPDTLCAIACDSVGKVYVTDASNNRVQVFTADGKCQHKFRYSGTVKPQGIAVDSNGFVYLSIHEQSRVVVYSSKGRLVKSLDSDETGLGQFKPSGLTVDSSGVLYVCNDSKNSVHVF